MVLATDDEEATLPDHSIALDTYLGAHLPDDGTRAPDHVHIIVPQEAFTHMWTLAHGGHVSGMVLATVVGVTVLEDLFAWARMWNDRRFIHAASEALLFQRGVIGLGNDIHRCCAQFLDARDGAAVMMGGDRVLEYRENAKMRVADDDDDTVGHHSAVFAVDEVVRMIVFVHSYVVFVRLTPFRDRIAAEDAAADATSVPLAVTPFDTTQNTVEFHGHCLIYEGDGDIPPLKYVPLV